MTQVFSLAVKMLIKMPVSWSQCCGRAGEATNCSAGIPYGRQLKSRLLHFLLLHTLESSSDGASHWVPATHTEGLDGAPGSQLQPSPVLAMAGV